MDGWARPVTGPARLLRLQPVPPACPPWFPPSLCPPCAGMTRAMRRATGHLGSWVLWVVSLGSRCFVKLWGPAKPEDPPSLPKNMACDVQRGEMPSTHSFVTGPPQIDELACDGYTRIYIYVREDFLPPSKYIGQS